MASLLFECVVCRTFACAAAYGWVLLVLVLSVFLILYLAYNVIQARIRFAVKPPDMYAVPGKQSRTKCAAVQGAYLFALALFVCVVFPTRIVRPHALSFQE